MNVKGYIKDYDGEKLTIVAPFEKAYLLDKQDITDCEIRLNDGRTISNAQRRKIFALVSDIGDHVSRVSNRREYAEMLRELKLLYVMDKADKEQIRRRLTLCYCNMLDMDMFSLSNVDMTTARDFISWLIEKCIQFDIPTNDSLLELTEEIGRYLYLCVAKRRCAICGKKADIHEVDKVGAGRNRRTIHHLHQRVQPLCRKHHMEVESIGQKTFDEKYHMEYIRLDSYLCKVIGWKE